MNKVVTPHVAIINKATLEEERKIKFLTKVSAHSYKFFGDGKYLYLVAHNPAATPVKTATTYAFFSFSEC